MTESQVCCSCHQEKQCFCLRNNVNRCADCICDRAGRSVMDLFQKAIKAIPSPIHVLVAISGGPSSLFLLDIMSKRLVPNMKGKTTIVRKLEAITSKDIFSEGYPITLTQDKEVIIPVNKIPQFTIQAVVDFANSHDFNCIILGDNVNHIALANLAALQCGRPELSCYISADNYQTYQPISIIRPARETLQTETEFYCKHKKIPYDESISPFYKAFSVEFSMLNDIQKDSNAGIAFTVQRLGEKLPPLSYPGKCTSCGLPSPKDGICDYCAAIQKYES